MNKNQAVILGVFAGLLAVFGVIIATSDKGLDGSNAALLGGSFAAMIPLLVTSKKSGCGSCCLLSRLRSKKKAAVEFPSDRAG